MTNSEWKEVKAERRQLWCEVLILGLHHIDPAISTSDAAVRMADQALQAYDQKFASALTPIQQREREGSVVSRIRTREAQMRQE